MDLVGKGGDQKAPDGLPADSDLRVLGMIVIIILALGIVTLGQVVIDVALLIFSSILFAVVLRIPGEWVHKITPLSKRWATILSLLFLISVFLIVGALLAPNISQQFTRVTREVPRIIEKIQGNLSRYPWAQGWLDRLRDIPGLVTEIKGFGNVLQQISGIFTGAFGFVANIIIFLVLSIYLAYEPASYLNGLLHLLPPRSRGRARDVLLEAGEALKWWIIGRLIAMLILGSLVGVGLALIGVPLSLTLGIITGLLSFVPIIGGVIAFLPAGLVALAVSPLMLLYVFLLYLAAQTVENYLLTPIVQRQTVSLAPAVALIIQLIMGVIAGPFGVALAYPVAVIGQVFVREGYIKGVLGDRAAAQQD